MFEAWVDFTSGVCYGLEKVLWMRLDARFTW